MAGTNATFANSLLKLLFNAVAIANIADNAASAPLTNLYTSLHTGDPGNGNQTTSEAAYSGYSRTAVARTSAGWTVSTNTVVPVATISFPACTGGSETETYAGIGTAASSAGSLMFSGTISPTIAVSSGVTPQLTTGSTLTMT